MQLMQPSFDTTEPSLKVSRVWVLPGVILWQSENLKNSKGLKNISNINWSKKPNSKSVSWGKHINTDIESLKRQKTKKKQY